MPNDNALIAIMNSIPDFLIARDRGWYRMAVADGDRLRRHWPPGWIAFYHTKVFPEERYAIHYYAQVERIRRVRRYEIFPEEVPNPKSDKEYYQIFFGALMRLPRPIPSRRLRRVTFIPTTLGKLLSATEINDLWLRDPLEERMWEELRRRNIPVERVHPVQHGSTIYYLDFAIYCAKGNLDIEIDSDAWQGTPARAVRDSIRDNDLARAGWKLLRFDGGEVRERLADYCIPAILRAIEELGGVDEESSTPEDSGPGPDAQLGLFEGE